MDSKVNVLKAFFIGLIILCINDLFLAYRHQESFKYKQKSYDSLKTDYVLKMRYYQESESNRMDSLTLNK